MTGFATPEDAALAEWHNSPEARIQIVSVEYLDARRAVVITDTQRSHPMRNFLYLDEDGWHFGHDHMPEGWVAGGCECDT